MTTTQEQLTLTKLELSAKVAPCQTLKLPRHTTPPTAWPPSQPYDVWQTRWRKPGSSVPCAPAGPGLRLQKLSGSPDRQFTRNMPHGSSPPGSRSGGDDGHQIRPTRPDNRHNSRGRSPRLSVTHR